MLTPERDVPYEHKQTKKQNYKYVAWCLYCVAAKHWRLLGYDAVLAGNHRRFETAYCIYLQGGPKWYNLNVGDKLPIDTA